MAGAACSTPPRKSPLISEVRGGFPEKDCSASEHAFHPSPAQWTGVPFFSEESRNADNVSSGSCRSCVQAQLLEFHCPAKPAKATPHCRARRSARGRRDYCRNRCSVESKFGSGDWTRTSNLGMMSHWCTRNQQLTQSATQCYWVVFSTV